MKIRIHKKGSKYVIQKRQWLFWQTAKQLTARKNPKWWQTVDYLKPCIFDMREHAEAFLDQHQFMVNNDGEEIHVEYETL